MGIEDIRKFQEGPATLDAAAAATDALSCRGVWDGITCEVIGVVGQYQAGFFPIMMFGLPGAALAIYLRAKTKRRKAVGALMRSEERRVGKEWRLRGAQHLTEAKKNT